MQGERAQAVGLKVCVTVYRIHSAMIAAHFKYNSPVSVRVI